MSDVRRVELAGGGFSCVHVLGERDAPVIALVPPLGMPSEVLSPFAARLATTLRVISVDLPGTGSASGARAGWTTRDLGDALVESLEAAGIERAHLFGISLGGMVAQWAAIGSDRFDSVVLASTAAHGIDAALADPIGKLALARRLLAADPGKSLTRGIVSPHVRHDAGAMQRIESAIEEHPRDTEDLVWLAAAAARHDARAELPSLRAPVLVVSGRNDTLVPPALQDELHALIPGARRAWIEDAGHDVTLDQPTRTADAVLAFVASL
ncbi:MAG: alpha/beta hydrolase [Myxococcota bacterium]|nr:alpha/beta hydrolase [Myxococcota bacterium]